MISLPDDETNKFQDPLTKQQQQSDNLGKFNFNQEHAAVGKYRNYSTGVTTLVVLFNSIFCQALCLYMHCCNSSDIEAPKDFARIPPIIFFLTMIIILLSYYSIYYVKKQLVLVFCFICGLYMLALFILTLVTFIVGQKIDEDKKQDIWNQLSTISKDFYDNDIDDLVSENKLNMGMIAVYLLVLGLLFGAQLFLLIRFNYSMPSQWRPSSKKRTTTCQTFFIEQSILEQYKMKISKIQQQIAKAEEEKREQEEKEKEEKEIQQQKKLLHKEEPDYEFNPNYRSKRLNR